MPTNKHATIRYNALDRCFSNFGKKYYIDDLVEACNTALYEYTGITTGVKKRQVFEDITFMLSDEGWSIPLNRIRDGKKVYYRYNDPDFSIASMPVKQNELEILKDTISLFSRFKGLPQFKWIDELSARIELLFDINNRSTPMISFEENPYLKGLNYFGDLFNAIKNQKVVQIEYKPFNKDTSSIANIHPYFLKQYNSRWFLFGYNETFRDLSIFPIDRIQELEETSATFIENKDIDFNEYFDDIIGVTFSPDKPITTIRLKASKELTPYINNKPIHGSQRILSKNDDGSTLFEIRVQINYELLSCLFSYMDGLTVESPNELRDIISSTMNRALKNYS